ADAAARAGDQDVRGHAPAFSGCGVRCKDRLPKVESRSGLILIVTPDRVGNYALGIRRPPYFVIASGAKQSRAVTAHSGLLRSARNDVITDAKGISADQVRGDDISTPPAG